MLTDFPKNGGPLKAYGHGTRPLGDCTLVVAPYPRRKNTTAKQTGAKHAVVYVNKVDTMQASEMVGSAQLEIQELLT